MKTFSHVRLTDKNCISINCISLAQCAYEAYKDADYQNQQHKKH